MKIGSVADVKTHFSAYIKASEEGPVVVTRNGKPVAALLAVGDEEELERLLMAYSPRWRAILDAARNRVRSGAGIPHEAFWRSAETGKDAGRRSQTKKKAD
ncbi:MAG: type II toxin-antitoxin system Phd/YefM family antitoxin [Candidatus Sumerlaeota bacterium]|nr:type II toxin-antitoxin system Phd/YefM family antitoxin [Candidatus Sumerlaeota bacterium]